VNFRRRKSPTPQCCSFGMNAQARNRASDCVVSVSGRITIDSSPDLRSLLIGQISAKECAGVTVDLYEVSYVDTSALAVLVETLRTARGLNKTFRLSGLRDRPRYLLEATGLLHLFDEIARESYA
jgi:anti-sigma B factor antagonist